MKRWPKISTVLIRDPKEFYKFVFPVGTTGYCLSARTQSEFKLAYKPEEFENGDYITIHSREEKPVKEVQMQQDEADRTIYLSCIVKGEIIEVEFWR